MHKRKIHVLPRQRLEELWVAFGKSFPKVPSLLSLFSYSDILVIEYKDSNLLLFNTCTTILTYYYLTRVHLLVRNRVLIYKGFASMKCGEYSSKIYWSKFLGLYWIPGLRFQSRDSIPVEIVPGSRDCKPYNASILFCASSLLEEPTV